MDKCVLFIPGNLKSLVFDETRRLTDSLHYQSKMFGLVDGSAMPTINPRGRWAAEMANQFIDNDLVVAPWMGNSDHACARKYTICGIIGQSSDVEAVADFLIAEDEIEALVANWATVYVKLSQTGKIHQTDWLPLVP